MKVILYMAISTDGYIAKKDGDSDWVSEIDSDIFNKKIKELGCIVVGRKTFDQYRGELYPVKGVTNIVVTTDKSIESEEDVVFVNSPREAIKAAKKKGYEKMLLIGGGTVNGMFLKEGLIDEIFLDVHPLVLGSGIKLFENCQVNIPLKLLNTSQLEGNQVLLHYVVDNP